MKPANPRPGSVLRAWSFRGDLDVANAGFVRMRERWEPSER